MDPIATSLENLLTSFLVLAFLPLVLQLRIKADNLCNFLSEQ
jgi:hypothetical protein